MNDKIMRWGGIFAIVLAVAYVASLALSFSHGVDIYSQDTEEILTEIDGNKELYLADAIGWALAPLLLAPVLLGLFFTVREEDRPWFALPVAAFALSSVLIMVGEAFAFGLADIASNYAGATGATKEALLSDGEAFLTMMLLLASGAGLLMYALGMLGVGVLSVRSGFFPRWFAIATTVVGTLGLIVVVSWAFVLPGRVLWLLISGLVILRRTSADRAARASTAAPMGRLGAMPESPQQ